MKLSKTSWGSGELKGTVSSHYTKIWNADTLRRAAIDVFLMHFIYKVLIRSSYQNYALSYPYVSNKQNLEKQILGCFLLF